MGKNSNLHFHIISLTNLDQTHELTQDSADLDQTKLMNCTELDNNLLPDFLGKKKKFDELYHQSNNCITVQKLCSKITNVIQTVQL